MGSSQSIHGKSKGPKICKKCQDIVSFFRSSRQKAFTVTHFGPLADLLEDCALCQLIHYLVQPAVQVPGQAASSEACSETSSQPVKKYAVFPDPRYQWKNLRVEYNGYARGYFGTFATDDYTSLIRQAHELLESSSPPKINLESLKGLMCSSNQQASINLIREWLRECEEKHGTSCKSRERWYANATRSVYADQLKETLLIDVLEKRLVPISLERRYMALTYVWGKANFFQTTKANRDNLSRQGALSTAQVQLPQTIRDAMEFVEALGERYLWVDALCIVQDDESQKYGQIARMHEIYDAAVATIVALSGRDANSGLPGLRPQSRQAQRSIEVARLQLLAIPPPLEEEIRESYWESRAWTLQERTLSRRLIYFSASQLHFQCQKCVNSEVAATKLPRDASRSRRNPAGELFLSKELLELFPLVDQWVRFLNVGETQAWSFPVYSTLVEHYTARKLSYEADIVHAFSGIMKQLQNCYGGKFFSGLPEAVFDLALLWVPGKGHRREPAFPTWSWTSWVGRVDYFLGWPVWPPTEMEHIYPTAAVEKYTVEDTDGSSSDAVTQRTWTTVPEALSQIALTQQYHVVPGLDVGQHFAQGQMLLTFQASVCVALDFTIDEAVPPRPVRGTSSVVHRIIDPQGRHCGVLFTAEGEPIPRGSVRGDLYPRGNLMGGLFAFVLISVNERCKPTVYDASGGPIQVYDESRFRESEGTGNAVLVEFSGLPPGSVAKRVAVAQIHRQSWMGNAPQSWAVKLE